MAADLYIHTLENGCTEADLRAFFSSTLGSKWYSSPWRSPEDRERAFKKVADTPGVWIGEVSWLKAGLFEDSETYIPGPVMAISDLVDENLPILDQELLEKIMAALVGPNTTQYSLAEPEDVREWLQKHLGKRIFTVSW